MAKQLNLGVLPVGRHVTPPLDAHPGSWRNVAVSLLVSPSDLVDPAAFFEYRIEFRDGGTWKPLVSTNWHGHVKNPEQPRCSWATGEQNPILEGKQVRVVLDVSRPTTLTGTLEWGLRGNKPPEPGPGSIAASGSATTATATSASSLTISSHTVPTGSDRVLIVGIALHNPPASTDSVSTVDWNTSEGCTQERFDARANFNHSYLFRRTAPTETTASVAIVLTGTSGEIIGGAFQYTGVDQTTPVEANAGRNSNSGTISTLSITTLTANAWAVDTICIRVGSEPITPTSPQVERYEVQFTSSSSNFSDKPVPSAGATNMEEDWGPNARHAHSAIALKELSETPVSQTTESDYEALEGLSPSEQKDFESLISVSREL